MSISLFSFFSGVGILDLAFERNRYNIVLVNEYSTQFIEAYKYARQQLGIAPPVYGYYEKSAEYFARKRGKKRLNELMQAERGRGNLVGFIGGPPCPDFSVAGKNRGSEGEHGKLTKTYFDIICRCKPDFFVFENVKGLVRTQKHKARDKHVCCPIYATIFSTATKDFMGESCETPELYIGYASKSEKLDGVHRNIVKAAINALIQQYKIKYKAVVNKNCDILAQNPDLVEYLYGMARAEGEPGYELLQQWISFMASYDMEQSDEMLQLVRLSGSLDAYEAKINWNLNVPKDLANAAYSENFSPTVNKFCTATAPGDIFEYNGKLYVLVGQDCDYMMGEKRSRNAPLCEFVSAELVAQGDIEKLSDDEKYVYINNYVDGLGNTYVLKVNYGSRVVVCNEIINLCSFNQEGHCQIDCEGGLSEDLSALLQPYMLQYYEKLSAYFKQVKEVNTTYPDFYKTASDLKTTKPLIDISHYQERDTVLDYGIKRISRLKKTASLYLYKMFLEYRGRMPYTTINLTGYSIVTAMIKSEEKEHLTTVHIKLTSKRNTNQKDRTRLTWYVKREELQEAINAIVDGSLILESDDEYIELQGKGEIELSCGAASVILKKQIKDDMYTIDVNLKSIGEA